MVYNVGRESRGRAMSLITLNMSAWHGVGRERRGKG